MSMECERFKQVGVRPSGVPFHFFFSTIMSALAPLGGATNNSKIACRFTFRADTGGGKNR